jgi:tetratricopeptide (TPR) repeat protein
VTTLHALRCRPPRVLSWILLWICATALAPPAPTVLEKEVPVDEARVAAERTVAEGRQWQAKEDRESLRKALDLFKSAVPMWEAVGDRAREAEALNLLGTCHQRLGEIDLAMSVYDKALALAQQSGSRLQEAEARNNLGILYDDHLADPRALSYYESALALWEAEGDRLSASVTLLNLGQYWA